MWGHRFCRNIVLLFHHLERRYNCIALVVHEIIRNNAKKKEVLGKKYIVTDWLAKCEVSQKTNMCHEY